MPRSSYPFCHYFTAQYLAVAWKADVSKSIENSFQIHIQISLSPMCLLSFQAGCILLGRVTLQRESNCCTYVWKCLALVHMYPFWVKSAAGNDFKHSVQQRPLKHGRRSSRNVSISGTSVLMKAAPVFTGRWRNPG